jgi:hypothetical protein
MNYLGKIIEELDGGNLRNEQELQTPMSQK